MPGANALAETLSAPARRRSLAVAGLAFLALLALLAAGLGSAPARAQTTEGAAEGTIEAPSFEDRLKAWNQALATAEAESRGPTLSEPRANEIRADLGQLRAAASIAIAEAETELSRIETRLAALGPAPAEGEPPEAEAIADQRKAFRQEIAELDAQVKESELVITKANQLDGRISALLRAQTVRQLSRRVRLPLDPDILTAALPEGLAVLRQMAAAPAVWWETLSLEERSDFLFYRMLLLGGFVAIGFGAALRYFLLRWLRRDPAETAPSYTRRLFAAIGKGLADGAIPAVILAAFLYRSSSPDSLLTGLLGDMAQSLFLALIILVLAAALPRAVLAPDLPAWRLLPLLPENARRINHRITLLAAVFAVDLFFLWSTESLPISLELESLYSFITTTFEAIVALTLLRSSLWRYAPEAGDERAEEEPSEMPARRRRAWMIARRLAALIALASIAASVLGYADLGSYLINNLIFSAGMLGCIFLLRGLGRELIGVGLRTSVIREALELRHQTRSLLKFWFRFALDITAWGFGLGLGLLIWGVPRDDLWNWVVALFAGFRIGNVRISLGEIVTAAIVFLVVVAITRMLQRTLNEKVFPRTRFDMGVRNSLSMALGYVGFAVAALIGIQALGLDLSNLAIIAGALSVGIGFGLQAIVNNFVSGLILLVERPVKVGDWVIIGGYEGTVKRISVRATEIETFDRQSVIIPNSELISSAVGNWTHKNRLCRVMIDIGVAYGSDTTKVREVLLRCAAEHHQVLKQPAPYVVFRNFGDSSLDFQLRCFLSDVDYFLRVPSDLRFAIDEAFREEGIEIPFPQRDLHVKSIGELPKALAEPEAPAQQTRPRPVAAVRQVPKGEGT
ncbi:MAG: mechanosensitive ion channel [Kiloniellales bacterium]|nr:mechanosensitive ion channel [Kiloniellales bacterium]